MKKVIIAFIIICILLFLVFSYSNDTNISNNEILKTYFSPNNKFKIVVFNRNINSTTGKNYQISILKSKQKLKNDVGNVFITDSDIECSWISNNEIQIIIDKNASIFKKEEKYKNITIMYETR